MLIKTMTALLFKLPK